MLNPNDTMEDHTRPATASLFSPLSMRKSKKIGNLLRPGTAAGNFYQQIMHTNTTNTPREIQSRGTILAPQDEQLIEINSYLPLAMLIYFHTFYSVMWLLVTFTCHLIKYSRVHVDATGMVIFWLVLIGWTVIEFPRLLIGYTGNLKEKVPRVFAFMILSTIQPLMFIYFLFYQPDIKPLDIIIGTIQLVFYVLEYIFGIVALRIFTRVSGIRYKMYFNKDGTLALDDPEEDEEININKVEAFEDNGILDDND